MNRELLDHARRIENALSQADVWELAISAFRHHKLTHFIYQTQADRLPPAHHTLSNLPGGWPANGAEVAEAAGEEWFNPFLEYCCGTFETTPVGMEYLPNHEYVGAGSKAFIRRAQTMGVTAAIAIPTRLRGTGRHGGFVLGNGYDRFRFEREVMPAVGMLQAFCLIVHRRLESLQFNNTDTIERRPLSARERQTLALGAKGMRATEIAHTLSVSEASIRLYQKNARAKLGARTMQEAIAIALRDEDLRISGIFDDR